MYPGIPMPDRRPCCNGPVGDEMQEWPWRISLTTVSGVSAIVALGHAAFYWRLGTTPDAVGISYGELAGQAIFGTLVLLAGLFAMAALVGWLVHFVASGMVEVPDAVRIARGMPRWAVALVVVVCAALGIAARWALVDLPARTQGTLAAVAVVVVTLTALFLVASGAPRRTTAVAVPWQAPWTAGVVVTTAVLAAIAVLDAGGPLPVATVNRWGIGLLVGMLTAVVVAGVLIGRHHQAGALPPQLRRGAAWVTLAAAFFGLASFSGLAIASGSRLVKQGVAPRGSMFVVVGAPVQCVRLHWIAPTPAPPLPEHAMRLGAANGHVALYDPVAEAPLFPSAGTVHTASAAAERCRRP